MAKRFATSSRRLLSAPKIYVRAEKLTKVIDKPDAVSLVEGLNGPESRIWHALKELRVNFSTQRSLLGGSILGGARADFLLPDYRINLEYSGPMHATAEGRGRDALRTIGVAALGYRLETLYDRDLPRLKPRILELIGRPI